MVEAERGAENPEWEKWFGNMARGSWALRYEWIGSIREAQGDNDKWTELEAMAPAEGAEAAPVGRNNKAADAVATGEECGDGRPDRLDV
jgi:hypothetical protein